jgi:hypothetical protein
MCALLPASTVAHVSFKELSTQAHRVAVGKIERITSYKDIASGRILSRVEVSEARSIPDSASVTSFSFEMTGGTVGDLRQWIAGFPSFEAGDRVVLFLAEETATPFGPTVGLWQGVFFIETDPLTGSDTVTDHRRQPIREIRGEELVVAETTTAADAGQPVRAASPQRLGLEEFVSRISALRAAGRRGDPRR